MQISVSSIAGHTGRTRLRCVRAEGRACVAPAPATPSARQATNHVATRASTASATTTTATSTATDSSAEVRQFLLLLFLGALHATGPWGEC